MITSDRKDQCTITRLKTGHTNASHKHIISKEAPQKCPHCSHLFTVTHLLESCEALKLMRKNFNLPISINEALGTLKNCILTLKFLKFINAMDMI